MWSLEEEGKKFSGRGVKREEGKIKKRKESGEGKEKLKKKYFKKDIIKQFL